MKASTSVKPEGTKTESVGLHAVGTYVFQIEEGLEINIGEGKHGKSVTMKGLTATSLNNLDGGDVESVGRKVYGGVMNIAYTNEDGELVANNFGKQKNFDLYSALAVYCGGADTEQDIVEDEQFLDHMRMTLPGTTFRAEVKHMKYTPTDRWDADTEQRVEIPESERKEVTKAYFASIMPDSGDPVVADAAPQDLDY